MRHFRKPFWLYVTIFGCVVSARADPILIAPASGDWTEFGFGWQLDGPRIVFSILLEAILVTSFLSRMRTPRYFLLWVLGMHVITYPLFVALALCILPLFGGFLGIAVSEIVITSIEGYLIYVMCRWLPGRATDLPTVSVGRSMETSVAGNLSSFAASFLIAMVYKIFRA